MALKPVSVTQLNEYISRVIGTDPILGAVAVQGEISGIKYHSTGHVYFSIIDAASKINCFLSRDYAKVLPFQMTDGMEVILTGGISVFKKNGTYSLYVRSAEISGSGDLAAAFEAMKAKLNREGLFDTAHKKEIPPYPDRIGVITSPTGAAIRDILKIIKSRNQTVDVILFPVLVQGDSAAGEIAHMIDFVNENYDDIDTLIVGRGGGSTEDLWPFNEEIVARAIYRSEIPVISAVGHEIDFTISDLVADRRAETPTAAAQLAVPDTARLKENLRQLRENLYVQLSNKLMYYRLMIDNLAGEMRENRSKQLTALENLLEKKRLILEENNPAKILENGYAILTENSGHVVTSVKQLAVNEGYQVILKDGYAKCLITETGSERK